MHQIMITIVFMLSILVMLIIGGRKRNINHIVLADYDTSASLKGVAIMIVFAHHYLQVSFDKYNNHTFLGYLGVAIFLFIAGYASQKQFNKKEYRYLTYKFIGKKVVRLFVPYILVNGAYGLIVRRSLRGVISTIGHVENDWFLCTIMILYMLFFCIYRIHISRRSKILLMTSAIIGYMVVCQILNIPFVWYNTTPAFIIGMIICDYEYKIIKINNTIVRLSIVLTFSLSCLFAVITMSRSFYPDLISMCMVVSFTFLMVLCLKNYQIFNVALKKTGDISWEFYLVHAKVLTVLGRYLEDKNILYFTSAFLLSLILGFALNKIMNIISKRLYL